MKKQITSALLALILGAGCSSKSPVNTADGGPDSATASLACSNVPSEAKGDQFGTLRGRSFADFNLNQCDGTPYQFYNEEFCAEEHTFTVVSIAAGWCAPCKEESRLLTNRITNVYGPQGVRVIQVLVQDENYNHPTEEFCNRWVSQYNLTNVQLMDTNGLMNRYFPDNSLPSTLIIDDKGAIVFAENGATEGLVSLKAKLDQLLAQ